MHGGRSCRHGATPVAENISRGESYYAVLHLELVHYSGATHRLDCDFSGRFGDDAYAMKILVAEMGAAFLCAEFGIALEPHPDHAAYIGHWLRMMKGNKRMVFAAASKATAAVDYLMKKTARAPEAAADERYHRLGKKLPILHFFAPMRRGDFLAGRGNSACPRGSGNGSWS